jgi:hypothetical protein
MSRVRGVGESGVTAIGTGTSRTILISSVATGSLSYNDTDSVAVSSSDVSAQMRPFSQITLARSGPVSRGPLV